MRRRPPNRDGTHPEGTHPEDEALLALLEDHEDGAPAEVARRHVARCPVCTRRIAELRTLRRVLQAAAAREAVPSRDLAREALARVRRHQAAIGGINELLAVLGTLLRGFAMLLAGAPPRHRPTRVS